MSSSIWVNVAEIAALRERDIGRGLIMGRGPSGTWGNAVGRGVKRDVSFRAGVSSPGESSGGAPAVVGRALGAGYEGPSESG